jgi:hypothetical protein
MHALAPVRRPRPRDARTRRGTAARRCLVGRRHGPRCSRPVRRGRLARRRPRRYRASFRRGHLSGVGVVRGRYLRGRASDLPWVPPRVVVRTEAPPGGRVPHDRQRRHRREPGACVAPGRRGRGARMPLGKAPGRLGCGQATRWTTRPAGPRWTNRRATRTNRRATRRTNRPAMPRRPFRRTTRRRPRRTRIRWLGRNLRPRRSRVTVPARARLGRPIVAVPGRGTRHLGRALRRLGFPGSILARRAGAALLALDCASPRWVLGRAGGHRGQHARTDRECDGDRHRAEQQAARVPGRAHEVMVRAPGGSESCPTEQRRLSPSSTAARAARLRLSGRSRRSAAA